MSVTLLVSARKPFPALLGAAAMRRGVNLARFQEKKVAETLRNDRSCTTVLPSTSHLPQSGQPSCFSINHNRCQDKISPEK